MAENRPWLELACLLTVSDLRLLALPASRPQRLALRIAARERKIGRAKGWPARGGSGASRAEKNLPGAFRISQPLPVPWGPTETDKRACPKLCPFSDKSFPIFRFFRDREPDSETSFPSCCCSPSTELRTWLAWYEGGAPRASLEVTLKIATPPYRFWTTRRDGFLIVSRRTDTRFSPSVQTAQGANMWREGGFIYPSTLVPSSTRSLGVVLAP